MSNPNPPAGGPPLRALAMTLIALAIVFAGIGAMSLSNSSSGGSTRQSTASGAATTTGAAPRTSANSLTGAPTPDAAALPGAATTTTATGATTTSTVPAGALDKSTPVRVLNNSTVQGLANETAGKLQDQGWTDVTSGNYSADVLPKSAVYYGNTPGEQAAAQAIAASLGLPAQPRFPGIADSPPGVIVILTGN